MKLTDEVYLVGGGDFGFGVSGKLDCHVYAVDGGDEIALIDSGLGDEESLTDILANMTADGLDVWNLHKLFLTHYHADHCGGAARLVKKLGLAIYASRETAAALRAGDEDAIGLTIARRAGFYPPGYHIQPVSGIQELADMGETEVGKLRLIALETPGHCNGHLSFALQGSRKRHLFAGDLVFFGGRISLQNIPDCNIQEYADSVLKLQNEKIDALLPGHMQVSLRNGQRHIDIAAAAFRGLGIPSNLI